MNNDDLKIEDIENTDYHPIFNKKVITIELQEDGNWRGFMWKNGKLLQARQSDPGNVLQALITRD